jgi:microcystin degradation protein MlrC
MALLVNPSVAAEHKVFRVAVAFFEHEATTFNAQQVDINDFAGPIVGAQVLAYEEVASFTKAMEREPVQLIGLTSPGNPIGASSRGWITNRAFEFHIGKMIEDLRSQGTVNGVYLALHGAAAVVGVDHPEAEIARRIRTVVGPNVPIVATFDLHGNQGVEFLQSANAAFAVKYFPHYDYALQTERAAHVLLQMMRGDYVATSATRKVPILIPTVMMATSKSPFSTIVQRALVWEASFPGLYVNVFLGFPWADVGDAGMTIEAISNGDQTLADRAADDMKRLVWESRRQMVKGDFPMPAKAVRHALRDVAEHRGPIVLADYSDRAGDATFILEELLRQHAANFIYVALRDENVLADLLRRDAKVGEHFEYDVGGRVSEASGAPVRIAGDIEYLGHYGDSDRTPCVIVSFGDNNHLVISRDLVQAWIPEQLASLPLRISSKTIFIVKSRVHFRRAFEDTGVARSIYLVDAPKPYVGTVHLEKLPYKNIDIGQFYPYMQ